MTDNMKKYLLEQGLLPHSDFAKAVGIETPTTLDAIFLKAHVYIQYKEKMTVNYARHRSRNDLTILPDERSA